jgi:hypothetical protein
MKKILILFLLIVSNTLIAQIPGKKVEGPIVLFDTLTVNKGDVIYLGKGSNPETGDFMHIYAPKGKTINTLYQIFSNDPDISRKLIPQKNLSANFSETQLVIESFSVISLKKKKKKMLGVINMKSDQFTEGKMILQEEIFLNNVVVDFVAAFQSGEILKISAPIVVAEEPELELSFTPFELTPKGILPVIVKFDAVPKNELYDKALNWAGIFYNDENQAVITAVPDENIQIKGIAKNVKFTRMFGTDVYIDLPYVFTTTFIDGEITMTYSLGDENGDIKDTNNDHIEYASVSPKRMFNKKGEPYKMSRIFKTDTEKSMNELAHKMLVFLMQ